LNDLCALTGIEDEQILAVRTQLRSNRLNASGMNKIARSRSATPYGIKRKSHVQTAATTLLAVFGGGQPVLLGHLQNSAPCDWHGPTTDISHWE
jgi:hypothetical protein